MTNDCIKIGLDNNASSMKKLCQLAYPKLSKYDIISYYKLCAISRAAGILANRKKSIKRGFPTRDPYTNKRILTSCYGFKIKDGLLRVPLGSKNYYDIPLNAHTRQVLLSDPSLTVRSFTLTANNSVSISYSKDIVDIECSSTDGIDRNLRNLTVGNCERVVHYDLSETTEIAELTKDVIKSFKRNDTRIRRRIASKYGRRGRDRINQILHRVSKTVVETAKKNKTMLVLEDIRNIRRLYLKGNGQNKQHRYVMNSGWSFGKIRRQIEYKAAWEGVPLIQLSKHETRGTSKLCPRCGKRTQGSTDPRRRRDLWCEGCKRWLDRDVLAAMNLSLKGLLRFGSSKGDAGEAVMRNVDDSYPLILRVDASKLSRKT